MREFAGLGKLKTVANSCKYICKSQYLWNISFHVSLETRLISLIIYFYILTTNNAMQCARPKIFILMKKIGLNYPPNQVDISNNFSDCVVMYHVYTCYRVPKKGDLVEMAMTPLKNAIEMEKVGVFWKIQHKCSKIGIKMFKLMEKWLRIMNLKWQPPSKMGQIKCIKFWPLLRRWLTYSC